jgi:hypothetical protein
MHGTSDKIAGSTSLEGCLDVGALGTDAPIGDTCL